MKLHEQIEPLHCVRGGGEVASEQKTLLGVNISNKLNNNNIIGRGVVAKYFNRGARIYWTPWAIHILNLTCGWTHAVPPLFAAHGQYNL